MQPTSSHDLFTTTVSMPLELRAALDLLKAQHARRTGKRPPINALIVEALRQYVARECATAEE
jgi:hypothetical protein